MNTPARTTTARAPTRLDLAGGTLDIWPIHLALSEPAVTVNVAVEIEAVARVEALAPGTGIVLESRDRGERVHVRDREELVAPARAGNLLAAAVLHGSTFSDVRLQTEARSPVGAGLGGSSALLVTVLAALQYADESRNPMEVHALTRLAQDIETRLLGTPTGYQDYWPPLVGGCLALTGAPGGIVCDPLRLDLYELEAHLMLLYTGKPHHSGWVNWEVVKAWLDGDAEVRGAFDDIAAIANALREALQREKLGEALDLIVSEGARRRATWPGISTPTLDAVADLAQRTGTRGLKILGAGGGGSALLVLDAPEQRAAVERALAELQTPDPVELLPLRLSASGIRISS